MTASTWTWLGGTGASTIAANWTLTSGVNVNGLPQPGDVVLIPGGTIQDGLAELSGQGNLTVEAGATVAVTAASQGISLGQTAATAGTLTVTGSDALVSVAGGTAGVVIGTAGTADLFLQNGGNLVAGPQASGAIDIGVSAAGTGTVIVTGPGSTIDADGQINVGMAGGGALTVQNAATVISGGSTMSPSQGLDLGQAAGGSGTISVTGTNSLLSNTGAFVVGDAGNASLTIGLAGTVSTTPGNDAGIAGMVVGNTNSSTIADVAIEDAGSRLTVAGLLEVGNAGSGSLQLSNGATATAGSFDAGISTTGVGQIGLAGTLTELSVTGSATVGDGGIGVLSVLNGATFAAAGLSLGAQSSGSGDLLVLDQGSLVNLTGALNIGAASGIGDVTVGSGAAIEAPVVDLKNGQAILEGGVLDPTVLSDIGATASGFGTVAANFIIAEGTILSNGPRLEQNTLIVQGTVLGGGTLTVSGTSDIVGTTTNSPGLLQIGSGDTLEVAGAVLNAATTTFSDTQGGTYLVSNSAVDVVFQDATGVLTLDDIALFGGTIATWHPGDALVIATSGSLSNLGVSSGNTLTVQDSGTGGTDQIVFASAINPASLAIKNGNTIVGGTTLVSGSTLEISGGPYVLTNFDAAGQPQYTTLLIAAGAIAETDATDLLSGAALINQGTLVLAASVTTASLQNSGQITGDVTLASGATFTNAAGGTVLGSGPSAIQATSGPATVINGGLVDPATDGVDLTAGGSVSNLAGGTIEGTVAGVVISGGAGTVTNAGTIVGEGADAVTLAGGFANRVIFDPGAVFTGVVDGGNTLGAGTASTLELAAAVSSGTLTGVGTQFTNLSQIVVDAGASWTLAAGNSLAAGTTLTDQGQLGLSGATVTGGALTIAGLAGITASGTVSGGTWSGIPLLEIRGAGTGFFLVDNAGTAAASGVDIAANSGGSGLITVSGAGSDLTNTGLFIVGDSGFGSLAIEAGGTVATSADAVITNTAAAANSSAEVTGLGSNWQVAGALIVGDGGLGMLSISQGGVVTAASAAEATASGGDGVITVAGTGSALTLSGSLAVGNQAAGEVSVLGGGTLTALDLVIGNTSTLSSGNVDVEGAGSTLHILSGGSLNIGVAGGGTGILTIGGGATLSFAGTIVEAGRASFNNNGGVIDPDAVQFTSDANAGDGLNEYDLYVDNQGAVQIVDGTGTWDAPMLLTGTSLAQAAANINAINNGNGKTGEWQLSSGGTLVINANLVDAGQAIVFEDNTDTLVIGQVVNGNSIGVGGQTPTIAAGAENLLQAGGFQAAIWGYQAGDQILFDNLAVESDQILNHNTLELLGAGNTDLGSLTFFSGSGNKPLGTAGMQAAAQQMACFAAGTSIETVTGPRPVETLAVGDTVVTLLGGPGRIVWVGSRAVDCARHPRPETVWPVRIAAGAFGVGMPARELYVSPDHAVFVNGVLVPVKLLMNDTNIVQQARDRVVYYHVELPEHAIILAEGLTVESYLDAGDRSNFEPGGSGFRLFADFAARLTPQTAAIWETRGVAPLVTTGLALEAVRQRVAGCDSPDTRPDSPKQA